MMDQSIKIDNESKIGCSIIGVLAVIGLIAGALILNDMPVLGAITGGAIGTLIGVLFFSIYTKTKQKRQIEKEHPHLREEQFYNLCVKEGYSDLESKAGLEKFKLYVEANTFTFPDPVSNEKYSVKFTVNQALEAFRIGKEETEKAKMQKEQNDLKSQREQEVQTATEQRKFAESFGREKRILMCRSLAAKNRLIEAKYSQLYHEDQAKYERMYRGLKQPEGMSWGTAGGIASGIAGPAAGVVAAYKAQERNEQIKQSNNNLATGVAALSLASGEKYLSKSGSAKREAEFYEKEAEAAKLKLVEECPVDALIKRIDPRVKKKSVSKTGAAQIEILLQKSKEPLLIYDNSAKAVVDGSLTLTIIQNGVMLTKENVPLPALGAGDYEKTMEVILPLDKPINGEYDVKIEPNRLWAIEK